MYCFVETSIYTIPSQDITASLPIVSVVPEQVQADPQAFQFRHSAGTSSGIRENNRYQGKWDETTHGEPLLLYENKQGGLFVVDGHHRLEFAKRLNQQIFSGAAPKSLKAQILHESDGITPAQAKILGAYRNINKLGISQPVIGEKLVEAAEVLHEAMKQPELLRRLPALQDTPELVQSVKAAMLDDASFKIATQELPETIAVPIAAYTAEQPMPDSSKIQVLSVIANMLAPLKIQTPA